MRRSAFFLALLLLVVNGCVISPRRTVNGSSGSGGSNSEFSVTASPTSQSIVAGASGVFVVTVQAVNGFTGTVSLSASSSLADIVASFDNTSITGGSGTATLTVQTSSTTTPGTATITVFASDTANNVSQSISLTATVTSTASTAGAVVSAATAIVPVGCVNAPAGSGIQRVSFPATPASSGFTATFDVTPSVAMDASLGFFSPASGKQPVLNQMIAFSPSGLIQASDGNVLASPSLPYTAGATYHFRLVENLPAATYSVFVAPPGTAEIPLGTNLQVPSDQRGVTTLAGWGLLANAPDGATLAVCQFSLQ
jgi:hypothetical protein